MDIYNNIASNFVNSANQTASVSAKSDTKDYLDKICAKAPNVNVKMSNSFVNEKGKVTLCFSPSLVKDAITNPKSAAIIDKAVHDMSGVESFVRTHSLPDGTRAKSVSFVVDKDGNIDLNIEWEKPKQKVNKKDEEDKKKVKEKLKKKKVRLERLKDKVDLTKNPYDSSIYSTIADSTSSSILDKDV